MVGAGVPWIMRGSGGDRESDGEQNEQLGDGEHCEELKDCGKEGRIK
jgi:hypothetical protein